MAILSAVNRLMLTLFQIGQTFIFKTLSVATSRAINLINREIFSAHVDFKWKYIKRWHTARIEEIVTFV